MTRKYERYFIGIKRVAATMISVKTSAGAIHDIIISGAF